MWLNCGFLLRFMALAFTVATIQQSHATENFGYQLLQDILNDVDVQERDALHPITPYAGMGYNLLRENPEGDFYVGGEDLGIKITRRILNHAYTMRKEGYYNHATVVIPDQVEFHPTQTCMAQSFTRAYSGQTSYHKELPRSINASVSGIHNRFCINDNMTKVCHHSNCSWLPEHCQLGDSHLVQVFILKFID